MKTTANKYCIFGGFWLRTPAREHTAEELEALRELVVAVAEEAEEERAAVAEWLASE